MLRAVGVELEIAGFNRPSKQALTDVFNACVKWNASIGTDGSIGTPHGVEIRLAPAAGRKFVAQLDDVGKALKASGAVVNTNCGLHVHVDMRDVFDLFNKNASTSPDFAAMRASGLAALDRVVQTYWLMEPALYAMVDENRLTWRYCKSYRQSVTNLAVNGGMNKAMLDSYLNNERLPTYTLIYENWGFDRYQGLNMHAVQAHRTVEFRLHQGTVKRRRIAAWASLCAAMIEWAVNAKPEKITKLQEYVVRNDTAGRVRWLQKLAPTDDAKRYVTWRSDKNMRRAA